MREGQGLEEMQGAGTRIDRVMAYFTRTNIGPGSVDAIPNAERPQYDGLRAGAGWILGALWVAKEHGCTRANVSLASNDGNTYMEAWDDDLGALVTAVHHTYYGT
jgi:hypothetical protein